MTLHIVPDPHGTHAQVLGESRPPAGAHVLQPGESWFGIPYEMWEAQRGRTVDIPALQSRVARAERRTEAPARRDEPVFPLSGKRLRFVWGISGVGAAFVGGASLRVPLSWGFGASALLLCLALERLVRHRRHLWTLFFILGISPLRRWFFPDADPFSAYGAQAVGFALLAAGGCSLLQHYLSLRNTGAPTLPSPHNPP